VSLQNWNNAQVLDQLVQGAKWSSLTITYAFPTTSAGMFPFMGYNEAAGFRAVDANQQGFFRLAVSLWDDLIPQNFQQVAPSTPFGSDIEFAYSSTTAGYAHAGYPSIGSAWFSSVYVDRGNSMLAPVVGLHGFETILHELGHALGLDHMGNYDASTGLAPQASSFQDSTVYTIMSYFGPTGPYRSSQVADADWVASGNAGSFEAQTPMLHDVLAIQSIYGASTTTRTGDTVYGFNSNITGDPGMVFDFERNDHPILTIFDSAGTDTLNLSGWSSASVVSLVPGVYSSVNNMTNNLVIAYGAVIENAVGGSGADAITGNTAANLLDGGPGHDQLTGGGGDDTFIGGTGNDTIVGGEGDDTARFAGNFSAYRVSYNAVTFTYSVSGSTTGTDTVSQVELFQFADITRTAAQMSSSDLTAPTLNAAGSAPPDNGAIAPAGNIILVFSEAVQAGSGNIVIHNANGSVARSIAVTDTSQVSFSGNSVTLDPAADLNAGSTYYINMGAGVVEDQAGNNFPGLFGTTAYNFTTSASDLAAPELSSRSPADNASGVATSTSLLLTFSEPVQAGSGSITIVQTATGTPAMTIAVTDTTQVAFNGSAVTVDPAGTLAAGTAYHVTIASGAIRDAAGNAYAGISNDTAFNFTTAGGGGGGDTINPGITLFSPADNATSVATGANIVLTFNENVQAGIGNIELYLANGTLAASLPVTNTALVGIAGNVVTLNPAADLLAGTAYYVNMAAGVIRDIAGNQHVGIAGTSNYNFTTAQADDYPGSTPGSVSVNGAAVAAAINFNGDRDRFNVQLVAGKTYVFELTAATSLPAGSALGALNDPYLQLLSGSLLMAYDDDSAGSRNSRITFTAQTSETFTLSASDYSAGTGHYTLSASRADTLAPTLLRTLGSGAAVAPDTPLQLHLSEAVRAGAGDILVYNASGSVARTIAVGDTTQVTVSGNTVTIDLAQDLAWNGSYYLGMAAGTLQDLAGNAFGGIEGTGDYAFTTTAPPVADDHPWDTATDAVLTPNGAAATGTIDFADDADLFKIALVAGVSYTFDLERTAGGLDSPYLLFYSPSVEFLNFNNGGGEDGNARLTYTAMETGTHYLGAMDYGGGSGAYTLRATSVADDYPWALDTPGLVTVDGATAAGVVEFASDSDLFRVTLVSGTSYAFTLTRTASGLEDPYLQLFLPDGNFADYDDDSGGDGNAVLVYTAAASGTYFLGASDFGSGTGGYTLAATALADDYDGSFATEVELVVNGAQVTGTINAAQDRDRFLVELTAGHTYVFELERTATAGLADPFLQLFAPGQQPVASDDDGAGTPNARITYTASESGTYFIDARDDGAGTGLYLLTATEESDDDFPWDTSTTGVVVVDGPAVAGEIEAMLDADLFKVELEAGHTYTFDLTSTSGGLADPYLILLDSQLESVAEDDDGGLAGFDSSITYTATTSGTYWLGAIDFDDGTGGYTLSAIKQATVIVDGPAVIDSIELPLDEDYFTVRLEAGQSYAFSLTRTGVTGLTDPLLALYDFALADVLAFDDDSAGSLNAGFSYTAPETATYWLRVLDATDPGFGDYALAVARIDSTAPTLSSVAPADGSTGLAGTTDLVFTFSEPVQAGSGDFVIHQADGNVALAIAATDATQVSIAGNTVTLAPATGLAPGSYYVNIASGAFEDAAGNDYAGLAGTTDYNFTVTAAVADDHAWGVATTGTVPVGGAAATGTIETEGDQDLFRVTLAAGTSYLFNLKRTAGGLDDPYLYLYDTGFKLVASDDDGSGTLDARIAYTAASSGTYYLGSSDTGTGTGGYSLSAAISDLAAPTLLAKSPVDNASGVPVSSNLVLTFTEAMKAGSGDIVIFHANGNVAWVIGVTDPTQVTISGSTVTLNPGANLAAGTSYYINMAAGVLTDLAGNAFAGLAGNGAYDFTTAAPGIVLAGAAAAEALPGSNGDDTITGGDGDDTITGGAGADTIDGGSGNDTIQFTGNRGQYVLEKSGAGLRVADFNSGRDGTDAVQGAEVLRFADRNVDLTMASRVQGVSAADLKTLEELYVGFFNRVPEAEGLGFWIGELKAGVTLAAIAKQFYDAGVAFGVYSATMTDAEFIRQVYDYVLGRPSNGPNPPSAGDITFWTNYLNTAGQNEGTMVLKMLSDTHTFFENDPDFGFVARHLNNKAAVADYYAVQQGLSMNVQADNIAFGVALAALITPDSTAAAIEFIGVNSFNMLA
jgi:serralysin